MASCAAVLEVRDVGQVLRRDLGVIAHHDQPVDGIWSSRHASRADSVVFENLPHVGMQCFNGFVFAAQYT